MNKTFLVPTQLTQLLNEVKNELSPNDFNNILEFIEHNELGLAYETLCTQIYEYDIPITNDFYKKITFYGKTLEIQPITWMPLEELIIGE